MKAILNRIGQVAKPVLAGWVAVLLLLLQGVAASPDLHHWLHEDADGPHHNCAAVILQEGLVEGAPAVAMAPPPPSSTQAFAASSNSSPSLRRRLRPPEGAPPLA